MPIKTYLYPYKNKSNTCTLLAKELNAKKIKLENSKYTPKQNHKIINWGNTNAPNYTTYNKDTKNAANKLESFKLFKQHNLPTPEWTTDINEALSWLPGQVFARTKLHGYGGKGIVIFTGKEIAPLYVKYVKKLHEFRIHVGLDSIIDIQQKKKKLNQEVNYQIRNIANGWIYARNDIDLPQQEYVEDIAIKAIKALNLDFGAVDIIYNKQQNKYYILEVNTAPGLQGTTLKKYTDFLSTLPLKN